MSQELIYTSAPKGLRPGSHGFCTVASTASMPPNLAEKLEALSGYRHVFAPGDTSGPNPVVFSYLRLAVGGKNYYVLSRVADAGHDYTQRTNKIAHHVALDQHELTPTGPAWLMAQPGFMETTWEGEPRILPAGRKPPQGNSEARVCHTWESLVGDAGWAGVLAETATPGNARHAILIYKPGTDLLPLIAESIALLPVKRRWGVTFSTYYTKLPPGVDCQWRCVIAGSPEAKMARAVPKALVLDLTTELGPAEGGELVTAARTGTIAETVAASVAKAPSAGRQNSKASMPPRLAESEASDDFSVGPPPTVRRTPGRIAVGPGRLPKFRRFNLRAIGMPLVIMLVGFAVGFFVAYRIYRPLQQVSNSNTESKKQLPMTVAANDTAPANHTHGSVESSTAVTGPKTPPITDDTNSPTEGQEPGGENSNDNQATEPPNPEATDSVFGDGRAVEQRPSGDAGNPSGPAPPPNSSEQGSLEPGEPVPESQPTNPPESQSITGSPQSTPAIVEIRELALSKKPRIEPYEFGDSSIRLRGAGIEIAAKRLPPNTRLKIEPTANIDDSSTSEWSLVSTAGIRPEHLVRFTKNHDSMTIEWLPGGSLDAYSSSLHAIRDCVVIIEDGDIGRRGAFHFRKPVQFDPVKLTETDRLVHATAPFATKVDLSPSFDSKHKQLVIEPIRVPASLRVHNSEDGQGFNIAGSSECISLECRLHAARSMVTCTWNCTLTDNSKSPIGTFDQLRKCISDRERVQTRLAELEHVRNQNQQYVAGITEKDLLNVDTTRRWNEAKRQVREKDEEIEKEQRALSAFLDAEQYLQARDVWKAMFDAVREQDGIGFVVYFEVDGERVICATTQRRADDVGKAAREL